MDTIRVRMSLASILAGLSWKVLCSAISAILIVGVTATSVAAETTSEKLSNALKGGTFNLNFRYRYEFVDQDFPRSPTDTVMHDANASTLRTRLVYKSGEF
jgi:hypothetical protein